MDSLNSVCIFSGLFNHLSLQDRELQKLQQKYTDTRVSSNVAQLNVALQDVQRIMVQNIDDVLRRGEALTGRIACFFRECSLYQCEFLTTILVFFFYFNT